VLWIRVPLLLLLAAVLAAVLIGRGGGPGEPVATKFGATTQGREFKLGLDEDGRPAAFATSIGAICPRGTLIEMPWDLGPGDNVPFQRRGDRLRVRERGDGWRLSLDGRVGERGGLRGRLELVVRVKPERGAAYDCTSPGVTFRAGA
jgi:hypothetical protein